MNKRVTLVAGKPLTYAGRALRAGDVFEARPADARVLTGARLATYQTRDAAATPRQRPHQPPAPAAEAAPVAADATSADAGLDALRAHYEALAGKKAHPFWRAPRLEAEIAKLEQAHTSEGQA